MNLRTQAFLLTALIALILAVVVWVRRERTLTTLPFFLCNFFLLTLGAAYVGDKITGSYLFTRAALSAAIFLAPAYLYLTYSYLYRQNRLLETALVVAFGTAAAFAVTTFIPSIDTAMHLLALFPPATRDMRSALAVIAVAAPPIALVLLRVWQEKDRILRRRHLGLLGATALTAAVVSFDLATGGGPAGPIAIGLYHYYLYQSLVRYRTFNWRQTFGRVLLWLASALLLGFVYGLFFFFLERPVPVYLLFHTLVAAFVLMVLIYEPFMSGLETRAGEWIFRDRGDVGRRIDKLVTELAGQFSLERIGDFLVRRVPEELGLPGATVYAAADDGSLMRLASAFDAPERLGDDWPDIIRRTVVGAVTLERLVQQASESYPGAQKDRYLRVINLMNECRGRWIILMLHRGELVGLYLPAYGQGGDPAGNAGQRLAVLAEQAAVRIVNARIYEQLRSLDRLATLGELSASLAHEIRNPLGSMKGAAEYLRGEALPEGADEFVNIIIDEADRLNGVLTRFLDYARPFEIKPKPTDLNALIESTLARIREGEHPQGIAFPTDLSPDVGAPAVDDEQLRQVLINLIRNAIQAQPDGGEVRVSSRRQETNVVIEVADRGPGLAPGVRERLFTPFFTTKEQGSGLGLTISLRIINAHGGTLVSGPRPGGGSLFTITLPVEPTDADGRALDVIGGSSIMPSPRRDAPAPADPRPLGDDA
ncbi:hypothetical protein KDL45_12615 [bacterium]|nr:hypothetical protein [bacterium]